MVLTGVYREVVRPTRLAYTWQWEGEDRETEVTISLASASEGAGRTNLHLRHAGFPTEAARDDHVRGWTDCLDRLEAHLNGG
jgi:uncharacterized protein YndB with AHSA1/START domain